MKRLIAVGAACAAIGAAAGIASSSAASSSSSPAPRPARRGALARAVHADLVVPVRGGGFASATLDRGILRSVQGDTLKIAEGTPRATYRVVTLTLPQGARVRNDRQASTLSQLTAGERVTVLRGPRQTSVVARTRAAAK